MSKLRTIVALLLLSTAALAQDTVTLSSGELYYAPFDSFSIQKGRCGQNHLAVRFAATTATLNACNPLLEQGCGSTTLCRSADSPCTVAERTAYRLEIHNSEDTACSVSAVVGGLEDAAATTCASGSVQVGDACEPFGAALDLLLGVTDR